MMRWGREGDKRAAQIHEKRKEIYRDTRKEKAERREGGGVRKKRYPKRGSRIQ